MDASAYAPLMLLLAGVVVHLGLFIRSEWHLQAPAIVFTHVSGFCALWLFNTYQNPSHAGEELFKTFAAAAMYLAGLFGSIAVYRLFFHRLCAFPGPRLAALSKLWHVWLCRDSRGHLVLDRWRQEYGDVVRTGPNEITLFRPTAFEILDGHSRSDWYDLLLPRQSSIFTRDERLHRQRRRLWERMMAPASLRKFHDGIIAKVRELDAIIERNDSEPMPVNDAIDWFAFDSMGLFGFGIDFGLMRNQQTIEGLSFARSAMELLGPLTPAIWIIRLGFAFIPRVWKVRHWNKMLEFSDTCMSTCMETRPEGIPAPIASSFIDDYRKGNGEQEDGRILSGDGANLLVAASETSAVSITFLLYCLAKHPHHADKLRKELQDVDIEDVRATSMLPHLTGFINETLRLYPAIPTAVSRVAPANGITIDGTFVPGGTKMCAPRYSVHRLEDAFEHANDFIPERWYGKPELVKTRRSFAPFGTGHNLCVGKHLAMVQMRLVVARLVTKYRIRFAPGQANEDEVELEMKDQLAARPGRLIVIFDKV